MISRLQQTAPASMAGVALMIAPMADGYFPNPEDPAPPTGNVVAQLPPPYQSQIEGACAVASIPCESPNLTSGLGYTIETGYLRARLMEGTQINSALNVELVIEIRDDGAAFGVIELLPVCVVVDEQGQAESWTLNGTGDTVEWSGEEVGSVIDDAYVVLATTGECDPLLERRDILTIASYSPVVWGLDPGADAGFSAGTNVSWSNGNSYQWDIITVTGEYPNTGTVSIEVTLLTNAGTWPNNNDQIQCWTDGGSNSPCSYSNGNGLFFRGWPGYADGVKPPVGASKVFTVSFSSSHVSVSLGRIVQSDPANLFWHRPGSVGYVEADLYTHSSLTEYDVFASMIHRPLAEGAYMNTVDGYCGYGLNDCFERCGSPTDIGNFFTWVGCLFTPEMDAGEWWTALKLEVSRSAFAVDVQTLGTYLFSPMRAIGHMGRSCGPVSIIPASENLVFADGYTLNTCTMYEDNPHLVGFVWALLVALAFFGGMLAILRIFEGALGLRDPLLGEKDKG